MRVLVACYKTSKSNPGVKWDDKLINWWTGKKGYSHVELFVPDTMKRYTSSGRIGGVVKKDIKSLQSTNVWDYIEVDLPCLGLSEIEQFYRKTKNDKYDWLGILGFILPIQDRTNKWFCSEWVATVLKNTRCHKLAIYEPSKLSPNKLYEILKG